MDEKITTNNLLHLPDPAAAFYGLVEGIREGAAILSFERTVLTCNRRLAEMLKLECDLVTGRPIFTFLVAEDRSRLEELLHSEPAEFKRLAARLSGGNPFPLPVELTVKALTVGRERVFSLLATDLSRRRRAEERLAFQADLLANISDAVFAFDDRYLITYWNAAAEHLYGWTPDEVLGRPVREVIRSEITEAERLAMRRQLADTGELQNQLVQYCKDGTRINVEGRRIALHAPDGRLTGYVSVNRDITERVRVEAKVQESETRFRTLFQGFPLSAVIFQKIGDEFVITEHNQAAVAFTGGKMPEYMGKTARELYAARPDILTGFEQALAQRTTITLLTPYQTLSTREDKILNLTFAFVPPDMVLLINEDITEQKRAQDHVRQLNSELERRVAARTAELEQSKRRVTEILASIRDGFFSVDREWRVTYANERAARNVGLAIDEMIGQNFWEKTPNILGTPHETHYRKAMADRVPVRFEIQGVLTQPSYDIRVYPSPDGISVYWIDITERKHADEEIKRLYHDLEMRASQVETERARWQGVVEGIADEVWVCDAQGIMSLINLPDVTQMGLDEFEAKTVAQVYEVVDILNPDGQMRPLDQAPLLRALRGGGPVRGEEIMRHKRTGRTRYRQYSAAPTRDAAGAITGAVAIVRDVTEQKQTQEALRASEVRFKSLYQSLPNLTVVFQKRGDEFILTDFNQAAIPFTQGRIAGLVGQTARDIYTPRPEIREHIERAFAEQTILRLEGPYRLVTTGEEKFTISTFVYVSPDRVLLHVEDITERKRAELEIQSLARFPAENPNLILRLDSRGVILYANPASAAVLAAWGVSMGGVAPEFLLAEVAETRATQHIREIEAPVKDRTYSFTIAPVEEPGYINLYGLDITDRKQAEKNIRQLNQDLEQRATALEIANQELESFSYSVSHDLRTPLATIDGFSRVLQDDYAAQLPEEARHYLANIRLATRQMDELIQSLLNLSRLSRHALHKQPVNMTELVMQARETLQQGPPRQDLTFEIKDMPPAEADPVLLKQVWVNLIANALKFTRNRENARIEVGRAQWAVGSRQDSLDSQQLSEVTKPTDHSPSRSIPVGLSTVYYVRDNGVGFDMQQEHRLFGIFQRLHNDDEYEGTGVGLAIVQRIIHRHGGRVWAEGKVDEGATFYFTLPAPDPQA